jgi:hypothetical protein
MIWIQLDAYEGESQVMAGLVASVTNDRHQRGTGYPNDERCTQTYECDPTFDRKAQVKKIRTSFCQPVQ